MRHDSFTDNIHGFKQEKNEKKSSNGPPFGWFSMEK